MKKPAKGTYRGPLDWYFKSSFLLRIVIALVAGSLVGILFGNKIVGGRAFYLWWAPLSDIFIRLLRMIVIPVIGCSLIVGSASIKPADLGRIGSKTLLFYLVTLIAAVATGLGAAFVFKPGVGMHNFDPMATVIAPPATETPLDLINTIVNIIPDNPFRALGSGDVLQVVFFSILMGIAIAFLRENEQKEIRNAGNLVFSFLQGLSEVVFLMVRWVMTMAPFGVFALIMRTFALNGVDMLAPLGALIGSVYGGFAAQLIVVYGLVFVIMRLSPARFLKKSREAMLTAFVTRSSGGTLPLSIMAAQKMGIPQSVYSFALPIGATINMSGTTVYLSVCAIFVANVANVSIGSTQIINLAVTAVLGALGTAGVPGAGAVMLIMALEAVGINLNNPVAAAAYAMIFGIDTALDMGRTMLNVTGDLVGAVWVSKREKLLDIEIWNQN